MNVASVKKHENGKLPLAKRVRVCMAQYINSYQLIYKHLKIKFISLEKRWF